MAADVRSRTAYGPAVATAVSLPSGEAVMRIIDDTHPIELSAEQVVQLFAVGLRLPEPDRTGWVQIGEIEVDDGSRFTIGATDIDGDLAMEAVRRGIEWALHHGLQQVIEESETTQGGDDDDSATIQ